MNPEFLDEIGALILAEGPVMDSPHASDRTVMVDLASYDAVPISLVIGDVRALLQGVENRGGYTLLGWRKPRVDCTYLCTLVEGVARG
jgi:hypothetical protein